MSNKLLCKLFISYSTASFRTVFLDEEVRQPHTRPISTILHTHPLTAIHSLGHKNIPGLSQDPRSIFPVPCHQPAMFKYRDKQLYYDSSIITGVYVHHCHWMYYTEQRCASSIFWRLRPHHCLANSKNFQDHAHLDFQDFSGPGNFTKTIPGLSGRCGNAASTCTNTVTTECIQMNPAYVFFLKDSILG